MKSVAYYRTSSATNVGGDKDSRKRQADACVSYAIKNNMEISDEFYDPAVSGSDAVVDRPGFSDLLEYITSNNINTILIETVNRFSRDLIIQLTGYEYLKKNGIILIPVDCPNHFQDDTATAKMVRQILGAVAEFEKTSLVDKLRKARDRKRKETGRCEGRKPVPAEVVALAKSLRANGMSFAKIGMELFNGGYGVLEKGEPTGRAYLPMSVKHMIDSNPSRN